MFLKRKNVIKICRFTASVILAVLLLAGCGADRETAMETQNDSEIISPESTLPETDMSVDEPEEETVEPDVTETESDAEASEEEDVVQYDCAPIIYDLTQLPAMKNEFYAEWEGKIYFRQYSEEDIEDDWLSGPAADTEKELMCMEADGSVTQVGVDYGYDEMYIVEGRIYSQKRKTEGEKEVSMVYSCGLDGSDVIEYASCEVRAVRGDRIICSVGFDDGISWIDAKDGQEHILIEEFDSYHEEYLDATEDEIFCSELVWSEEAEACYEYTPYDLVLYSMDYQGNKKELAVFTLQEYENYINCRPSAMEGMHLNTSPLYISYVQILGDDLYVLVGTTNGTGHGWTGGTIYGMKKDGSNCQMLVSDSYNRNFYLYDDGENRALYFASGKEAEGIAVGNGRMRQIPLSGEPQEDIVPYEVNWRYDEPWVFISRNNKDSILFYPDTSGICYVLLTEEECEELSIELYVDGSRVQKISDIEYLDGKLFFTVTDLTYSTEYSIGWRDGYERGRSVCYCKELESGEIRLLYEY